MDILANMNTLIRYGEFIADVLGDCPNVPIPIIENGVFWREIGARGDYRLQENSLLGIYRVVDIFDIRVAWGSKAVMTEKWKRLSSDSFLRPGDVVGVNRGIYEHYAVYIGDDQVIHYSGTGRDMGTDIRIRQASFSDFVRGNENYYILFFEDNIHAPRKIHRHPILLGDDDYLTNQRICNESERFTLYSEEETVERAKARLNEKAYNLVLNNCEHFAIWCKTGLSSSFQVERVSINSLRLLSGAMECGMI